MGQLVEAPDGKLWTLPEYGGPPSVVDLATGQAEGVAGLKEINVSALAFSGDTTWAGTSDGLLRLKGGSQRLLKPADGLPGRPGHYPAGDAQHALDRHGWRPGRLRSPDRADHRHRRGAGRSVWWMPCCWRPTAPFGWGHTGATRSSQMALYRFAGTEHRRWSNGETPFGADRSWCAPWLPTTTVGSGSR